MQQPIDLFQGHRGVVPGEGLAYPVGSLSVKKDLFVTEASRPVCEAGVGGLHYFFRHRRRDQCRVCARASMPR